MNEVLNKLQTHVDSFGQLVNFNTENREYIEHEKILKETLGTFSDRLQERIGEQDTEVKLSVFIKLTQARLTEFSDRVFQYHSGLCSSNLEWEIKLKSLYIDIENKIIKVLEFLRINFSPNFDFFAKVPMWVVYEDKDVPAKKMFVINGLKEKAVDENLISIITNFLDKYQDLNSFAFENWHQYLYYKNLLSAIFNYLISDESGDDSMNIIKLLIGYNFNPLVFYNFMVEFGESIVSKRAPFEEQEIALLNLLKTVGNIRPEVSIGYNPEVQPILDSISGSILHELAIIAKLKEVESFNAIDEGGKKKAWQYFEVSTTLEELFFLLKVMQAVNFLKTRYNANLYRFVERHIKTDRIRNSNASPHYMRNIFAPKWEFSSRVVKKVRSWLTMMIAYIDAQFPEQLRILVTISFLEVPVNLYFSIA
ncbi:hypothetical protein SAMN05421827_102228 [Pedobacter terrae]|uniref:Uncharacterized protein n=1 Tax=Pedobacter terrae TaxID=405671 RepID=A0A1G7Q9I4_9SPHI|nr:hypothetical protein [Pedobacter terrae]SDF95153.1 hypothetical protein SAMN05421827_102228 [Pedobacter terrae]